MSLLAVASAVTFSCINEKDELELKISDRIGYNLTLNNGFKNPKTKSENTDNNNILSNGKKVDIEELESKIDNKKLYLHTITSTWNANSNINTASANNATKITEEGVVDTKGAFITNPEKGDNTMYDKEMGVSALVYNGDAVSGYSSGKYYFVNDILSSPWSSTRYWPESNDQILFYAYAPNDVQNGEGPSTVTLPQDWGDSKVPSFDFTVPTEVIKQSDLLVASKYVGKDKFGQVVPLTFNHALTAVQFMIEGVDNLLITKVTLSGVKNSGTYSYAHNHTNNEDGGSWSNTDLTNDEAYVLDYATGELEGQDGIEGNGGFLTKASGGSYTLNSGNFILFLMPQSLPADATITIEGKDISTDEDVKLSAQIGGDGKVWEKGKHVIYRLSTTGTFVEYIFEIEDVSTLPSDLTKDSEKDDKYDAAMDPIDNMRAFVPFYGQLDRTLNVKSYKMVKSIGEDNFTIVPLPWSVEGNIPDWIDRFEPQGGSGSYESTYETISYDAIAQRPVSVSHENLRYNASKGTKGDPYDLSMESGSRNTANCYIIDAPGYYKIPLVYGNAILGGANNPAAYTCTPPTNKYSTGNLQTPSGQIETTAYFDILERFYNYAGDGSAADYDYTIKDPWITKDSWINKNNLKAEIVWQDEPCVITEAKIVLNGVEGYLHFRVREDCICESNSVVAVKLKDDDNIYGKGTIFWSWHIWITDKNEDGHSSAPDMSLTADVDYYDNSEDKRTFEVMSVPLGFCDREEKTYEPRKGKVTFVQFDNGVKRDVTIDYYIRQVGEDNVYVVHNDNAVYYQFGRKDPFLPAYVLNRTSNLNKPYYTERRIRYSNGYGGGRVGFHMISGPDENGVEPVLYLNQGISIPGQWFQTRNIYLTDAQRLTPIQSRNWYGHAGMGSSLPEWSDGDYDNDSQYTNYGNHEKVFINLWNNNNTILPMITYSKTSTSLEVFSQLSAMSGQGKVIKTIYDPSPYGYEMPAIDAFAAFTQGGLNYETTITFNQSTGMPIPLDPPFDNEGAFKFTDDLGKPFRIPALGYRSDSTGHITEYGRYGGALTANPVCAQMPNNVQENGFLRQYFQIGSSRLYFVGNSNIFWPISISSFANAFPVMPARTNRNPVLE